MTNTTATRRWEPDRISVPAQILHVAMSPTALRLWIALAAFANRENRCWPSTRRLVELMPEGTNDGSVRRARAELEKLDLLVVSSRFQNGRQTSNFYELRYPWGARNTARDESRSTARDESRETARPLNLYIEEPKQNEEKERLTALFDTFWDSYGKKVGKKAAKTQWAKQICDEETANVAIAAAYAQSVNVEQQFRKDPERWLKDHRWTDEQTVSSQNGMGTLSRLRQLVEEEGLND
mgnify:CR=1 FL=1|jgi:hypothetical protein